MRGLRYATHLGYRSTATPLFLPALGMLDPSAHIEMAAKLGFQGVQIPHAMSLSEVEVADAESALASTGLEASCLLCTPRDPRAAALWTQAEHDTKKQLDSFVLRACALALRLRSKTLAAVPRVVEGEDLDRQRATLISNLRHATSMLDDHGVTLCIEPMRLLPDALLRGSSDAVAVVKAVDHPSVRMVFDTAHSWDMEGDVVAALSQCYEVTSLVQLADQPGRVEPGAGRIDLVGVLRDLMLRGFEGIVGLENEWSLPGVDGMNTGLETFWKVDTDARRAVESVRTSGNR